MIFYISLIIVRIFKNIRFTLFACREDISDSDLKEAVKQLEVKQATVNLGGNVYKVRLARPGEGKSGGYRVIVLFKSAEKTFYVYGFAKSDKTNINEKELKAFKKTAKKYFSMTDEQIKISIENDELIEI